MKRQIKVYSKTGFRKIVDQVKDRLDIAIISIEVTPECARYYMEIEKEDFDNSHILESGPRVLNLEFDDINQDYRYKGHLLKTISREQAIEIVSFIDRNLGKDIIVHCKAGTSRSQGIQRYILDTFPEYYEEDQDNPCLTPNIEVVRRLKRAYREKENEHPWFSFKNQVERLYKCWEDHKNLVIGFDFDGTIYDTHENGGDFRRVIGLLRECKEMGFTMCLWTAEPVPEKLGWKKSYCEEIGIKPDYINESPLMPGTEKPYFNILLDDRCGLPYTYEVLKEVVKRIKKAQEPYV